MANLLARTALQTCFRCTGLDRATEPHCTGHLVTPLRRVQFTFNLHVNYIVHYTHDVMMSLLSSE